MALKDAIGLVKDSAVGLREVAILALLAVLLFDPPVLAHWLELSRLDKVSLFGISMEARQAVEASRDQALATATQAKAVENGTKVTEAKVAELAATLQHAMASGGAAPGATAGNRSVDLRTLASQVDAVQRDLAKTRAAAELTQARAKTTVISQTQVVEKAGGAVQREGWVWVGQIDPATSRLRDVGEPETVLAPPTLDPSALRGQRLTFSAPTYVYRDPFDGAGQPSAIIGVATGGQTARIAEAKLLRFNRQGLPGRDPNDQILWARVGPN